MHTAIVGTANPKRWLVNAKLADKGNLPKEAFDAIREKWQGIAKADWIGQDKLRNWRS